MSRSEGDPWSFADPDAGWWRGETDRGATDAPTARPRHPRRRASQHQPAPGGTGTLLPPGDPAPLRTGAAAEAHTAGARDAADELDTALRPERAAPPTTGVERDHDQPDAHRYDPLHPPAGHAARQPAAAADHQPPTGERPADPGQPAAAEHHPAADARQATAEHRPAADARQATAEHRLAADALQAAEPPTGEADEQPGAEEPDVMVLPEPNIRNRPTVPLEPGPGPGARPGPSGMRLSEPLPPATGSPVTDARLERLENSPFWLGEQADTTAPAPSPESPRTATHRRTRRTATRRPAPALLALVALALIAAFFAWVSAEPFWLAAGHGDRGYATVARCTGSGVTQRCTGQFSASDGRYSIARVTLLGVGSAGRAPGSVAVARMVSPGSRHAYLGSTGLLLQLRWILGFTLVLFCGYGIAGVTGARRLDTARARRGAVLLSLAAPVTLLAGFLIAAF